MILESTKPLIEPAKKAGIRIPSNPEYFDPMESLQFHAFCMMQIGEPIPDPEILERNAKIIAEIPIEEIMDMTIEDILARNYQRNF